MHAGIYPEVPDDFGHWLAGFIDGEGSFTILGPPRRPTPRFGLSLRDDDLAILQRIIAVTGVGRLDRIKPSGNFRSKVVWAVGARRDCQRLVQVLDRYPLRAKKARDYAIWREAVLQWGRIRNGGAGRLNDWQPMERLREQLAQSRAYEPPPRVD